MVSFAPWGELSWILERLGSRNWGFLGCIAHEDRCVAAPTRLDGYGASGTLVCIYDADPADKQLELSSLERRKSEVAAASRLGCSIVEGVLLATIDEIERVLDKALQGKTSVVIDITSLPKRWFFVIARLLHDNRSLEDIIFTYTPASKYATTLSWNPEVVKAIPTFTAMASRSSCDVALVSIGFHSQSILDLFDIERPKSIALLFPFPPGPPGIFRNWRFVERLERAVRSEPGGSEVREADGISRYHLAALDLPQSFFAMRSLTNWAERTSLVAPYGPKPISLAMCLFSLAAERASKSDVPAYYAQPTRYALDYTTGVLDAPGGAKIFAYPSRLAYRDLYSL